MVEFAQRPMVAQGMSPSAPNSVGTGITSGLVPENSDPIIQQGMQQFENTVENLYGKIDEAENMEEVINSIRGDEQPIKARVGELAELVGEKDAKKTPESVLAVMQPYFQILDMVQAQASDAAPGGIANAPMAGGRQSTVNFNEASPIQAPGSDEAAMRIAMGETPVNFAQGGFNNPVMVANPFGTTNYLSNLPDYAKMDFGNIVAGTDKFMELLEPYAKTGQTDPATLMAERENLLSPFLKEPRSKEDILAEQIGFFGDQDQQNLETQGALALAKFGAQVAQTPGSLLQALTKPVPEFATDLSKVAAQKAALDREQKEFAYTTEQAEKAQLEGQKLSIAMSSIEEAAKNENDLNKLIFNARADALSKGVDLEETNVALINTKIQQAYAANNQYGTLATETWGRVNDDGTVTVIGVRRTDDGPQKFDDGKFSKIPKGFTPMDGTTVRAYEAAGKIDYSDATAKTILIPDPTTESGLREVAGIFHNGIYKVSKSGNQVGPDGKPDFIPAPNGFIVGTKDLFSTSTDTVGRTTITFKRGPRAGQTIMTKMVNTGDDIYETELEIVDGQLVEKIDPNTNKPIIVKNPDGSPKVLIPAGASVSVNNAFKQEAPEYKYFDSNNNPVSSPVEGGSRQFVKGNPLAQDLGPTGINPMLITPSAYALEQRKILSLNQALNAADEVIESVFSSVGPINSVKSFVSNAIGGWTDQNVDKALLDYSKTARGSQNLNLFGRALARALALSDRYAVAEQRLIQELAIEPGGFFQSSKMSAVKLKELVRILQNDLNYSVATLNGDNYVETQAMPEGTANDPFLYSGYGQFDYLKIATANGANFDGKFMIMSNEEAKRNFPNNPEIWGAGGPVRLKIGEDITFN
tara:strand:- start:774 stop:3380 length:2607 start_codon:yes stop_codon:yes gene_type:complete